MRFGDRFAAVRNPVLWGIGVFWMCLGTFGLGALLLMVMPRAEELSRDLTLQPQGAMPVIVAMRPLHRAVGFSVLVALELWLGWVAWRRGRAVWLVAIGAGMVVIFALVAGTVIPYYLATWGGVVGQPG